MVRSRFCGGLVAPHLVLGGLAFICECARVSPTLWRPSSEAQHKWHGSYCGAYDQTLELITRATMCNALASSGPHLSHRGPPGCATDQDRRFAQTDVCRAACATSSLNGFG
jgi:hypothetical protein